MATVTTILKHGPEKTCFLYLVQSYQKGFVRRQRTDTDEIVVYEAELSAGKRAYFSIHGKTVELCSGDTVQLNAWYAQKLGLMDDEPLPLRRIDSAVPVAVRVEVEPVSTDDWEILERNAGTVELVLLDQVRVVWKDQLLPVWIKKICVHLRISGIEPSAPCVILENNTEVVVSPKLRPNIPPSTLNLPSQIMPPSSEQDSRKDSLSSKQSHQSMRASSNRSRTEQLTSSSEYDNVDILEPRPSVPSPVKSPRMSLRKSIPRQLPTNIQRQSSLMESVMKYLFMGDKKEPIDSSSDSDRASLIDLSDNILPSRNAVLRVQAMNLNFKMEDCFSFNRLELNKHIRSRSILGFGRSVAAPAFHDITENQKNYNIPLEIFQPSTVYVDAECMKHERLIHPYLPPLSNTFIARLQRLPSPQEKATADQKSGKRSKSSNAGLASEPSQAEAVESLDGETTGSATKDPGSLSGSCYVRVVVIDRKAGLTDSVWQRAADQVLSKQPLLHGHVIIPDLLRRHLRLESTGSVWIQTGSVDLVMPRKIHVYVLSSVPKSVRNDMLIMAFITYIKQCANEKHPLVVFQGIFLKFIVSTGLHAEVQLTFYGENDSANVKSVTVLSELIIDTVQIIIERDDFTDKLGVVNKMLTYCQTSDFDSMLFPQKLKQLGGVENLVQEALLHLHGSLVSRPLSRHIFEVRGGLSHGILLITGPKGSGKTSLVKGLCRKMAHLPILAHVLLVDCKTLRGKTVSTIQKILEMLFDEAAWREPAIIVLENLDVIVPAPSGPETEMTGESLYAAKNAQVIEGVIRYEIENNSRVTVIATSVSRSTLHPSLVSSRGLHCIQHTLNIGSPDKDAREKILRSIIQKHSSVTIETLKVLDLTPIAIKTEGFVARDLELLVNRTVYAKLSRDDDAESSRQYTLTLEDFEETLSTFKPLSVRNVPLHKSGDLGWEDVGGMNDVKRVLLETLLWPTKYPQLFSSCPLRLRSGILLYGAPGTGKTLLAGVVAKECGLNFISVKGPELLNKYIGASEQAVRDLFTKAQSAKPCILFFDEFDSIAPKRGHDSTGVTDRVVNQLLTQLDGVEGLQGVYVLGATSRPDLLDPALLRPGRLDLCLSCAIPDENERYYILEALTHKMNLDYDVDLREVAAVCEYFTGADLKALLYNAQLKVIHEQTDGEKGLNESVVYIKGNSNQCATLRRASVVRKEDGSVTWPSLSKSVSVNSIGDKSTASVDSSSPHLRHHSSEQNSPLARINSSDNRIPRSPVEVDTSEASEAGSSKKQKQRTDRRRTKNTGNVFEYPDRFEVGSGDEANHESKKSSDFMEVDGKSDDEIVSEVNGMTSSTPAKQSDKSKPKTQPGIKLTELDLDNGIPVSDHVQMDTDVKFNIKFRQGRRINQSADVSEINPVDVDVTHGSVKNMDFGSESEILHKDFDNLETSISGEDAVLYEKGAVSSHAISYRKKKTAERETTKGKGKGLTINSYNQKADHEASSPSMERPVTVFTSLERGQATLSKDDVTRYLKMIKLIQHQEEVFIETANAKKRTSLQLESKPSILMRVCQRHLLEAAKSMRPSVSASERERYMKIYEHFVSSRKGSFEKPQEVMIEKRATLA